MRDIGVGVIGTGFMGKAHSFAYRAVAGIFPGGLLCASPLISATDARQDAGCPEKCRQQPDRQSCGPCP